MRELHQTIHTYSKRVQKIVVNVVNLTMIITKRGLIDFKSAGALNFVTPE